VAENQSTDLEKNDLQIGVGTADNTGSSVEFSSMVHSMGLVNLTLGSKTVPSTRVFKPGSTSEKLFDRAPTTSITATSNFTASVASNSTNLYNKSTGIYLLVGKPSTTVTFTGNSSEKYTWNATYTFSKNTGNIKTATPSREYDNAGWGFDYTGAVQTFTAPITGTYKLEVWGAQGGDDTYGGRGGYSVGSHMFSGNNVLYICVGSHPDNGNGGYNGGGSNYQNNVSGGGGATHIAQRTGVLKELVDYKTDILLVAGGGGGGGGQTKMYFGGVGGGSYGGDGQGDDPGHGGTQTSGGIIASTCLYDYTPGTFGSGGSGYWGIVENSIYESLGGGGGGWYGGSSAGGGSNNGGGGGGSGYVGGVEDGQTIAGDNSFPSPSGGTETGHTGNGYAIITQVSY